MKRVTKIAAMIMTGVMIFASCQKENQMYRAVIGNDTKMHINGDFACWDNGDKVYVNGNHTSNIELATDAAGKYAWFECPSGVTPENTNSFFTFGNASVSVDGNDYVFTLPNNFTAEYNENGQQKVNIPFTTSRTGYGDCNFVTKMSVIEFIVPANVKEIYLTTNYWEARSDGKGGNFFEFIYHLFTNGTWSDSQIAGTFKSDASGNVEPNGNASTQITMRITPKAEDSKAYLVVPQFGGTTYIRYTTNNDTKKYTAINLTNTQNQLTAGTISTMDLRTISKKDISAGEFITISENRPL